MKTAGQRFLLMGMLLLAGLGLGGLSAGAQGGMKTITPPQGGMITYGQVSGQTTESGAMAAILHNLHQQLGEKPQVGKLFSVRGTESVACFFSVTRRDNGNMKVAGLMIVTKAATDDVEAALLTDDATRFHTTLGPMMKALFSSWNPLKEAAARAGGSGPSAPAAQLHQAVLPDNSASIELPGNWQIVPRMSGGGTLVAVGPNGEAAEMGTTFLASDPRYPAVQRTMTILRQGMLQNTGYAKAIYYPIGGDMVQTYEFMMKNLRQRANLPEATYNFSKVEPSGDSPQERCVRMMGSVDFHDDKGLRDANVVYCITPPNSVGGWLSMAYSVTAPAAVAARERATLGAVMASFQENPQVVQGEAARIAAPAIRNIQAIGKYYAEQAHEAHVQEDIHNSSVYQRWDSLDKRSQEFENYQLGYSVIRDVGDNAHGTFWNEDAEAIVHSHPDKFEYVNAPDYWKGIDY